MLIELIESGMSSGLMVYGMVLTRLFYVLNIDLSSEEKMEEMSLMIGYILLKQACIWYDQVLKIW